MSFHHKSIKKFQIEGTLYDDAHIQRLKREYIALVVLQMRAKGYALREDIDIDFTLEYKGEKRGYDFKLSVYGVYVGLKKAQEIDRIYGYKVQYSKTAAQKSKKAPSDNK